ncbi:hypothetical protein ONE63_008575 [Megalurothrips usitatus]|uniref:SUN domain-containing protein n=1 Tax=Megalurothrips usitatus TaxID=439358 RepID=A0AAV7XMU0_9NEOP|nr:hypothetical protein ONE63_008575 [Megalurothrips usitatus]
MTDRVLRPRVRNGPSSYSLSSDREKVTFSAGRRRHKEAVAVQNLLNTVAQDRFKHPPAAKKRVVFSSKRYTSDDVVGNGRPPQHEHPDAVPVVSILKHTPSPTTAPVDRVDGDDLTPRAPAAAARGRPRGAASKGPRARGAGRVAKHAALHASFTEEERTSPWRSASSSILAALALSVSPLARKRAEQAEKVAKKDEGVRRAVDFYKTSGEWWNVFPKTDYSYSPLSSFHREISPGVMTLPNMSRPGLHNMYPPNHETVASHLSPLRLAYSDNFGSDSDEVDDARYMPIKRSLAHQQQTPSAWRRVSNVLWTSVISIFTFISSILKLIVDRGYNLINFKQKTAYVSRTQRYYSYRPQQESSVSRMWSSFHEYLSTTYNWASRSVTTSTQSSQRLLTSRHNRQSWLIPLLLFPFLLLLLVWWFGSYESSSSPQLSAKVLHYSSSLGTWVWSVITTPFVGVYSAFCQILDVISGVIFPPLGVFPSFESLSVILYDICASPMWLLRSILDLLTSFGASVVSLFQMILASIFSFKVTLWDSSTNNLKSEADSYFHESSGYESDGLRALLDSALRKQEVSLLTKLSESEKNLRADLLSQMAAQEAGFQAKLAANDGSRQMLGAKVAYLQDELRRWRRRFAACCRRPESGTSAVTKDKLMGELSKLLSSPEGLVLLGAAIAHVSPTDRTPAGAPQFNETEVRAWVSSAFLDKDDFERAVANMTKYFNEELERRSAEMMAASTEEINARIASQAQVHLNQMSKLQADLSDSYYQNEALRRPAFSSGAKVSSGDDDRIRRIIESALAVYDADKTGMADYALESQGGEVVSTRCTETYQVKSPTLSVFGVPLWYPSNSPRTVIQPAMHPGECWAFVGSQGFLVIKLSHRIRVKGFTYEHISPVLLPTGKMDSAPKDFSVHGLRGEGDNDPILLGNYHYLQNSTSMQYFAVQQLGAQPLQLIEIQIKSNHGNINYTCMYRFRVHGTMA